MNNGDVTGPRGRGRGWNQVDSQPRELRRPHIPPTSEPASARGDNTAKFTLSAEAKEWYPANYVPPTTNTQSYGQSSNYAANDYMYRSGRFSVQDRLRINQAQDPYNFEDFSSNLPENPIEEDLKESIEHLITVMCEVTYCPGRFDSLCGPLVDSFASTLHDLNYTRLLVEAIVNQSIYEPNFRYNGARLCSMYDSISSDEESVFRSCLLERCSAEENKIITGIETSVENMRGFAMFLAEIYTQLEDPQGGRIKSLGESLCKILLFLLDSGNDGNVKTVCQLLKLSGIALDADCPVGMHSAFERLKLLNNSPQVRQILELRLARWGVQEATLPRRAAHTLSNGNPEPVSESTVASGDSIYMPDGLSLTAEESAFLQSHLPTPGTGASQEDEENTEEFEETFESGMDPEMQASFLEFLRMSNQIKR